MNKVLDDLFESAVQEKFMALKRGLETTLNAAVASTVTTCDNPLGSTPAGVVSKIGDIVELMIPVLRSRAETFVTTNIRGAMSGTNKLTDRSAYYDPFARYHT